MFHFLCLLLLVVASHDVEEVREMALQFLFQPGSKGQAVMCAELLSCVTMGAGSSWLRQFTFCLEVLTFVVDIRVKQICITKRRLDFQVSFCKAKNEEDYKLLKLSGP